MKQRSATEPTTSDAQSLSEWAHEYPDLISFGADVVESIVAIGATIGYACYDAFTACMQRVVARTQH